MSVSHDIISFTFYWWQYQAVIFTRIYMGWQYITLSTEANDAMLEVPYLAAVLRRIGIGLCV